MCPRFSFLFLVLGNLSSFYFSVGGKFLYEAVLVSAVQQCESVIALVQ